MTTTPITPAATGRRAERNGSSYVVYTRTFRAPIDDVWAAVTEPARLERWIGTWTGDPASGEVGFRMTAEGDDVPTETFYVDVCDEPQRLVARAPSAEDPETVWLLELNLGESDGVTTLTFSQEMHDPQVAESVGPGWDYYLDRLVTAEAGGDVEAISFDDYYPGLSEHYRSAFS